MRAQHWCDNKAVCDGAQKAHHQRPAAYEKLGECSRRLGSSSTAQAGPIWTKSHTEEHTLEGQLNRTADACCTEAYKADAYILVPRVCPRAQWLVRIIGHQLMAEQRMMTALRQHLRVRRWEMLSTSIHPMRRLQIPQNARLLRLHWSGLQPKPGHTRDRQH